MKPENAVRTLSQCEIEYIEHIDAHICSLDQPFYDDEKLGDIPTPFEEINREIGGGLRRKSLITIAGRPAMGKTTMALQWAEHAVRHDSSVLFVSAQATGKDIVERIWASHSNSNFVDFLAQRGRLKDDDWLLLTSTVGKLSPIEKRFLIDETLSLTLGYIRNGVKKANQLLEQEKLPALDMLLIDSYQSIQAGANEVALDEAEICRELRCVADEYNLAIIVISQVDHDVERRSDRRPLLGDLCGAPCLEFMSELVVMLYRDDIYAPDTLNQGVVECILRRNRWGKNAWIKLLFSNEPLKILSPLSKTGL